ncbi:MAG: hypothetical protein ACI82E_000254 [Nonlabens sp.]|jgi:hypothetical protein
MKKLYTILAALLLTAIAFAQTPEKMSYQGVVRNSSDLLISNQAVGMQISILQTTVTGTAVYVETQVPTTNVNGLVTLEIGTGSVVSGDFTTIDWSADSYFIKTETDPTGGTTYTITGTSQLMSVPYALYAKTSGSATPGPQGAQGADGATGTSGAVGATGAAGTNGTNGTQGIQGIQGAVGSNGASGATGASGADGATGAAGANGTDGAQGPQGPAGSTGLAGADGLLGNDGATGATGAQGPAGNAGATGPQGLAGNDGAPGAAGTNGTDGIQGIQGATGTSGADGAIGATGPQGLAGNDGAPGAAGTNGTDGATGPQGLAGNDGTTGVQGPVGNDGATGPQGLAGNDGATGLTGPQGPIGVTGATGAQGPVGNDGATGPQGLAGNDGATGLTGPQGPVGPTGPTGPAGSLGPQGITGADGVGIAQTLSFTSPNLVLSDNGGSIDLTGIANATHTGDVTGATALTITTNAVTTDKILDNNVTDAKIVAVSASKLTGTVGIANGGTNITTYTQGDILYATSATELTKLPAGTAGQVLTMNTGATAPEWVTGTTATYAIGDTHQGGIIFYLDASGKHGLIAAPSDQSTSAAWWNGSFIDTRAYGSGLFEGKYNTRMINRIQSGTTSAAAICANYGDLKWYLPSIEELNLMYMNIGQGNALGLGNIGSFSPAYYWSSTENDYYNAWIQFFTNGYQGYNAKSRTYNSVRAVRAF